jgi:hypothetical protein
MGGLAARPPTAASETPTGPAMSRPKGNWTGVIIISAAAAIFFWLLIIVLLRVVFR